MALPNPPEVRRLSNFFEALPHCPYGCDNSGVYETPSFRVPTPDDTLDEQVSEIIARYEQEAPAMLQKHLVEDHRPVLADSNRAVRDRIEAAIGGLPWRDLDAVVDGLTPGGTNARRCAAGVLRKAFAPELAHMRDVEDTLTRVRKVARQYPEDGAVPVRRIFDALYGEEQP